MEYRNYLGYGYPYQYSGGHSAVPYFMSPHQRPPVPLVDLTASTFGPCSSSSCGSSSHSSAGVGIAVNITPPGSAEVSQP